MYEVEVKIPADHDAVQRRLGEAGATRLGSVRQEDVYYDAPHRDFARTDEALRLRRERRDGEWRSSLAYKGPRLDDRSKTRREAETAVADREATEAILEGLGFEPAATVEKDRERYRLDEYAVVLDDVVGLGEFVEVEREVSAEPGDGGSTGADPVETALEGAVDVLRRLDLDPAEQIRTSYLGLRLGDYPE